MLKRKIYRSVALLACTVTALGVTFGGQASTLARTNTGISAAAAGIVAPFAPLTGTDSQMSTSTYNGDLREYAIDINPTNSKYAVLVAIHGATFAQFKNSVHATTDGGVTWTAADAPWSSTNFSKDPSVSYASDGSVYVSGVSTANPSVNYLARSTDNGATYGPFVSVPVGNRPTLIVDNGATSPRQGTVYIFGLDNYTADPGAPAGTNPLDFAKSTDGGQTWSARSIIAQPPLAGAHQSPMPRIASDGTIYVSYEEFSDRALSCAQGNVVTNKLARSTNGGATWMISTITGGPIVQGGTCVAGGTGHFAKNATNATINVRAQAVLGVKPTDPNTVYAIYGGGDLESPYTIGTESGYHSDTIFTKSTDGGQTWSPKTKVNGDGQGSDQFLSWMDVAPNGTIWAGWQDRREDPNNYRIRWYQAYSVDDGNTWVEAPVADSMSDIGAAGVGDYESLAADNGQVLGVWFDSRNSAGGDPFTEAHVLAAHMTLQGHPAQPDPANQQPLSVIIKKGTDPSTTYPSQTTDANGNVTLTAGVPEGSYSWWAKSPRSLANSGTIGLGSAQTTSLEMGTLRVGDANNDNLVSTQDFNILRSTFNSTTDLRADFNDDGVVSIQDFGLMRGNFGQVGAPQPASVGK